MRGLRLPEGRFFPVLTCLSEQPGKWKTAAFKFPQHRFIAN
jgi:hypothetical protein